MMRILTKERAGKAMRTWFFLIIRVLCCILAISSAVSAKDLLTPESEVSGSATIQPCPGENASGTVCHVGADGKVIAKGKLISPNEYASLTNLVTTLNTELRKRDKQHGQLVGELRRRDRELDKRDLILAQLREEANAYRKQVLDLEERKLAAQNKLTDVLEHQNQQLEEQVGVINANTAAQARIANGVQVILPATMLVGLLIYVVVIRSSIASHARTFNEVLQKVSSELEERIREASRKLDERLSEINTTFSDYFGAEARRQSLSDLSLVSANSNNGNGHSKPDTIPPGALPTADVLSLLERVGHHPEPVPAQSDGDTQITGSTPTLVETDSDVSEEEPSQRSTSDTAERMRELDSMACFQRPALGGAAAVYAKEQTEPSAETSDEGRKKLDDTINEKPGFWSRIFGRRRPQVQPAH